MYPLGLRFFYLCLVIGVSNVSRLSTWNCRLEVASLFVFCRSVIKMSQRHFVYRRHVYGCDQLQFRFSLEVRCATFWYCRVMHERYYGIYVETASYWIHSIFWQLNGLLGHLQWHTYLKEWKPCGNYSTGHICWITI